jgi:hypothetical protein
MTSTFWPTVTQGQKHVLRHSGMSLKHSNRPWCHPSKTVDIKEHCQMKPWTFENKWRKDETFFKLELERTEYIGQYLEELGPHQAILCEYALEKKGGRLVSSVKAPT